MICAPGRAKRWVEKPRLHQCMRCWSLGHLITNCLLLDAIFLATSTPRMYTNLNAWTVARKIALTKGPVITLPVVSIAVAHTLHMLLTVLIIASTTSRLSLLLTLRPLQVSLWRYEPPPTSCPPAQCCTLES